MEYSKHTQSQSDVYVEGIEEDPFYNATSRRNWKGPCKIALLKQAISEQIYKRPSSNAERGEQWKSLAKNVRSAELYELFRDISERSVQDKLTSLLKDYKQKKWDNMKRGMTKTEADSELAELKQLCLDYLRFEQAEKGDRQTNAKQKALVMKEQGQVIRGDSLETLKQKDGSMTFQIAAMTI